MELWVRSQDRKSLIKANVVKYDRDYSNKAVIQGVTDEEGWYIELGKYKTKERALEVLDEIQKLLMPTSEYKQEVDNLIINYENIDTAVYEMPEE